MQQGGVIPPFTLWGDMKNWQLFILIGNIWLIASTFMVSGDRFVAALVGMMFMGVALVVSKEQPKKQAQEPPVKSVVV